MLAKKNATSKDKKHPKQEKKKNPTEITNFIKHSFLISNALIVPYGFSQALDNAGPNAGAIQQELQRQIERDRVPQPQAESIRKPSNPTPSSASTETVLVKKFQVYGNNLVTEEKIQELLTNFTNKELTFNQIQEAVGAVSTYYQSIGRVAKVLTPPQNVKDGIVEIKVIEGVVGEVSIEQDKDQPGRLDRDLIKQYILLGNPIGKPINMFEYERSLALLNEIPGLRVSGDLQPGKEDSFTDMVINSKDLGFISGRIEASNYGSASTGVPQATANLNINNLTGVGDLFSIDAIGSQGSTYGQLRYGLPIGQSGFKVALGGSALSYATLSDWSSTIAQGRANTVGMYTSYALERTPINNTTVNVNIENKNYSNFSSSQEVSDYNIKSLSVGITRNSTYEDNSFLSYGATAIFGNLGINNAVQSTNDLTGPNTQGNYAKLSFNAIYKEPLPPERTFFQATVYGQLANKNLNSAEQFYLGGPYGVRAYPNSQGGGTQGVILSGEITHTLENQLQVGAFVDIGYVEQYKNTWTGWEGRTNAGNTYPLYALGLTAKYNLLENQVQLSGVVAFRVSDNPLYNQSGQQLNSDNQYRSVQAWLKATFFF